MVKSAYEPTGISGWSLSRFPKHETSALTMSNEVDNAYDMYQLMNFRNWIKKTGKIQTYVKKLIFGQTYMKFAFVIATLKMINAQFT